VLLRRGQLLSTLVTAAVLIGGVSGATIVVRRKIVGPPDGNFRTSVLFRDGSKVSVGSPVVIAGIRIGRVSDISIEGTLARVGLRLRSDLQIPADSWATKRADSLFGDGYVEIIPGGQTDGVAAGATVMLGSGEPIAKVIEGASTDAILRSLDRSLPNADRALEVADNATQQARIWASGNFSETYNQILAWLDSRPIEAPIERLDQALNSIDDMTARAQRALANGETGFTRTLASVDNAITRTRDSMRNAQQDMTAGLASARTQLESVDPLIDDLTEALGSDAGGQIQGKLGRLVNDAQLVDDITESVGATASAVSNVVGIRNVVGVRTEYDVLGNAARFIASAQVATRTDRFYQLEASLLPQGSVATKLSQQADGSWLRSAKISQELAFTAQYGKRFGRFSLRGGLKESAAGVGLDAAFGQDRLMLSADVFGSAFTERPNLRASAALLVFRSVYLLAGVDHALSSRTSLPIVPWTGSDVPAKFSSISFGRSMFVGGMLRFTDEDLNVMLRFYGAMIAGLL
jgi:phospholipid/cholesterol/gamma-HCH transport system substrate-binding protein